MQNVIIEKGTVESKINLANLAPGMYMLTLTSSELITSIKIMKE